jgi:hypothetical protein
VARFTHKLRERCPTTDATIIKLNRFIPFYCMNLFNLGSYRKMENLTAIFRCHRSGRDLQKYLATLVVASSWPVLPRPENIWHRQTTSRGCVEGSRLPISEAAVKREGGGRRGRQGSKLDCTDLAKGVVVAFLEAWITCPCQTSLLRSTKQQR